MTQAAYRNRDLFLEMSQPAVVSYRPSAISRVAGEPWLERSCRLEACSKLKNHITRTVPVKLVGRNNGTTQDYLRLAQKNADNSLGKSRNSEQTRCANSELEPWQGGRWLDVRGKSLNLGAKNKVVVRRFTSKTRVSNSALGAPVKPIPKSRSECKFLTEIESPASRLLRYSDSGLTVKASKRSEMQGAKGIRIPSFLKVAFAPSSKPKAETTSGYSQLQTGAEYPMKSRAPSVIRGLVDENYYPTIPTFWRPDSGREYRPDDSARTDLHSARRRLCCSPVSNICGRGDYSWPIQFRQDDHNDDECYPAGSLEPNDLRSPREPLSTTMLSAHVQEGPWASAVNKTHYILNWLADVNSKGHA